MSLLVLLDQLQYPNPERDNGNDTGDCSEYLPDQIPIHSVPYSAANSCRAIAAPNGIGTALPIWRAIATFEPTNL